MTTTATSKDPIISSMTTTSSESAPPTKKRKLLQDEDDFMTVTELNTTTIQKAKAFSHITKIDMFNLNILSDVKVNNQSRTCDMKGEVVVEEEADETVALTKIRIAKPIATRQKYKTQTISSRHFNCY